MLDWGVCVYMYMLFSITDMQLLQDEHFSTCVKFLGLHTDIPELEMYF